MSYVYSAVAGVGVWARPDAAYDLGVCLSTGDRRINECQLVIDYHQYMLVAGIEGFDSMLAGAGRRYCLYGLLMIVDIAAGILQTECGDTILPSVVRQHADPAIDLDAVEFLHLLRSATSNSGLASQSLGSQSLEARANVDHTAK